MSPWNETNVAVFTDSPCPAEERLRELLEGRRDAPDQASLVGHLDECATCRDRLQFLAASDDLWSKTTRTLREQPADEYGELRSLMARLQTRVLGADDTLAPYPPGPASGFLRPCSTPGRLGCLGPYEVVEILGRGGMGVVYKAVDPALDRTVAIKVLACSPAFSADARARFRREARAAAAVRSVYAVAIHAVEETAESPYLVMEYIEGHSLQERLDRSGPLEIDEILRIGSQIARGLAAAHAQALIHRDIKPANILLEARTGTVKITDFGLAKAVDAPSLTRAGTVTGTPEYMAPEQTSDGPIDHRADLFSLGSVLFAMCTGRPPFRAERSLAVLRRTREETPVPICQIRPGVPEALIAIIDKLHRKDPNDRYATAIEAAEALQRALSVGQASQPVPDILPRNLSLTKSQSGNSHRRAGRSLLAASILLVTALSASEMAGLTRISRWVASLSQGRDTQNSLVTPAEEEHKADGVIPEPPEGAPILLAAAPPHGPDKAVPPPAAAAPFVPPGAQPKSTDAVRAVAFPEPEGLESVPRTFGREARQIWSLAYSPDGKQIAIGSGAWNVVGEVHLLDAATGKVMGRARETLGVASVAFSPDGKLVASVGWEGWLRIRKTAGLELVHQIPLQVVARVAFSPDGKTIATATEGSDSRDDILHGRMVQLWDVETGKQRLLFESQLFRLHCVAFSPDGSLVAAGGGNWVQNPMGEVRIWNAKTGTRVVRLVGHRGPVLTVNFSPDGKTVVTGALDGTIRFWDPGTGKQKPEIMMQGQGWLEAAAYSPDGKLLASASMDKGAKLWDAETGKLLETITGYEGWLRPARFSPDGSSLAFAGSEGTVYLCDVAAARNRWAYVLNESRGQGQIWDVAKRKPLRKMIPGDWLEDPPEPIHSVVFSPDGKTMATAHEGKVIRLREPDTGLVRRLLVGHDDVVSSVAFSPNGAMVATASYDRTVKLWDAQSGALRRTLQGHANWVLGVAFSPDGKTLASCGSDKTVRLWDLSSGQELAQLEGHAGLVRAVAFSPDGKRLASTGADRMVKVWDVQARSEVFSAPGNSGTSVAFSSDGALVAAAAEEGIAAQRRSVMLWDARTGRLHSTLLNHPAPIWSLAFSPGGKTLAGGSIHGTIELWDLNNGQSLGHVRSHGGIVTSLAFAPDANSLVSGGADKTLHFWDTKLKPVLPLVTLSAGHGAARFVAFSPDGRTLATGGEDGKARLWTVRTMDRLREFGDHLGPANCAAFSLDGTQLALGGADRRITLWDTRDGRRLAELKGHEGEVTSLKFSPDGKRLASSAFDSALRVWELNTGRALFKLEHPELAYSLDWSPDGRMVAAGTYATWDWQKTHVTKIWDAATGREIASLPGHRMNITAIRFSPDSRRLATGGSEGYTLLWDVPTRTLLGRVQTHLTAGWGVPAIAFLPDGQTLIEAAQSGQVYLRDLRTLRESLKYEGHSRFHVLSVYSVAASPDGSVAASADKQGLVKLWPTFRGKPGKDSTAASLEKVAAAIGPLVPPPGTTPAPSRLIYSVTVQQAGAHFAAFSPDGKHLVAGGEDGTVMLVDAKEGRMLRTIGAHQPCVFAGAFSPDGRLLATGGFERTVKFWDVGSGGQREAIAGPAGAVRAVAFANNGESLFSVTEAGVVKRWDALAIRFQDPRVRGDAGGLRAVYPTGMSRTADMESAREIGSANVTPAFSLVLSSDGKLAVTGNLNKNVGVWNVPSFSLVAVLQGHPDQVTSAAISPDGRMIVSTSATLDPKQNVKLWKAGTWKQLAALEGHRGYVNSATFSPDGKTIATAGADLTVRLWNAADGKPIASLHGHTAAVVFVRFSPDGRRLASASLDGTVKVWNPGTP